MSKPDSYKNIISNCIIEILILCSETNNYVSFLETALLKLDQTQQQLETQYAHSIIKNEDHDNQIMTLPDQQNFQTSHCFPTSEKQCMACPTISSKCSLVTIQSYFLVLQTMREMIQIFVEHKKDQLVNSNKQVRIHYLMSETTLYQSNLCVEASLQPCNLSPGASEEVSTELEMALETIVQQRV